MSIKDDLKAIAADLSPIIAGFKLAVIIISYFGIGSVAKWIISYWYPFTRWIWDRVASFLSLPEFPIMVKDSLTALIFFLPLGLTAAIQRTKGIKPELTQYRFLGGLFGFFFLVLICWDAIGSIYSSISSSYQVTEIAPKHTMTSGINIILLTSTTITLSATIYLITKSTHYSPETNNLFGKIHKFIISVIDFSDRKRKTFRVIHLSLLILILLNLLFEMLSKAKSEDTAAVFISICILAVIISSLLAAITYVPKKLYITTGAAIAFMLAAISFETFISAKKFMESIHTPSQQAAGLPIV